VPLPTWVETFRPHQESAILDTIAHFKSGIPIVMIDAPTGSGKTLIAETVRQAFDWRAVYLCSTLALQDQFMSDFSYAALLRGRQNYPVADIPHLYPTLTASDCTKEKVRGPQCPDCDPHIDPELDYRHCRWCHPVSVCLYEIDKAQAIRSPLVCANLAYFLYESNYVGSLANNRDLIIVDEADLLEDQLLNFISVSISSYQQREYRIPTPTKKTVESSWLQWATETESHLRSLKTRDFGHDLTGIRKKKSIARLHQDLLRLTNPTTGLPAGNWVYTGYSEGRLEFKPIHIAPYAQEFFWRHGSRFLLMSATTISFASQAEALGLDQ
jgi:Rad3-related DNA helicase